MHWWMEDGVLPGQMVLEGMEVYDKRSEVGKHE